MSRKLLAGLAGTIAGLAFIGVAFGLTNPPTFAPRNFQSQQVGYFRINATYNAMNGYPCVLASGSCVVKVGALPYNAYVIRATQQIITNFNSQTTDTLALGISATSANELVAAQTVHSGAGNQSSLTVASAGSGVQVTGNNATQTGADGGFDLYVKYAQTGTAPTAGQAIIILEYIAPNDGTCIDVPMGATFGAC
jgi:hypothetical protein